MPRAKWIPAFAGMTAGVLIPVFAGMTAGVLIPGVLIPAFAGMTPCAFIMIIIRVKKTHNALGSILSTPAIEDGVINFGRSDGHLYAVDLQ